MLENALKITVFIFCVLSQQQSWIKERKRVDINENANIKLLQSFLDEKTTLLVIFNGLVVSVLKQGHTHPCVQSLDADR